MKRLLGTVETVAAALLLAVALLTAANVALRALTQAQIPDWFDGSKLLLGMALFWGIAVATYHGGHICVDVLWEHLGGRGRRVLDVAAAIVAAGFLAPMAWMVWTKVLSAGTQTTMDLRLPLLWFNSLSAAGAAAAALLALARLLELVRGQQSHAAPAGPEGTPGADLGS